MSWTNRTITPRGPQPPTRDVSAVSPPLGRFFGSLGFSTFGLGTLYLGGSLLGIDSGFWSRSGWGVKASILFVVSILSGLFGMLVGLTVGATIKVKSDRANFAISAMWHYLANGLLIWVFLLSLVLTKHFGREGSVTFLEQVGKGRFSAYTFGIGAVGCLLIGAVLVLARLLKQDTRPRVLHCLFVSAPIGLAMGYLEFSIFDIESWGWLFIGGALSLLIIPVSAYMIDRDRQQRRQIQEM